MCYRPSFNLSPTGKAFDCEFVPKLQQLGLLPTNGSELDFVDLTKQPLPAPVFVTGCSSNHWTEEQALIVTLQDNFPNSTIVMYDLGLKANEVVQVRRYCNVIYRKFKFENFPKSFRNLYQYRWKTVIIAVRGRNVVSVIP